MQAPDFIGIDWGSTAFRAWAMTLEGEILDSQTSEKGLKSVTDDQFAAVIQEACGSWMKSAPGIPIVMCGMVGSKAGWKETTYAACPTSTQSLIQQAVTFDIDGHQVAILPGACAQGQAGNSDVMRGEEIQLLGAVTAAGLSTAEVCIPGTHCKWAQLQDGILMGFQTFVTGELFQLLRKQSLVGALADGDTFDAQAFHDGLKRSQTDVLSHAVFAARANVLCASMQPGQVSSYLSGVLIGAEIGARNLAKGTPIVLMATGLLSDRYAEAFKVFGIDAQMIEAKVATRAGLTIAARALWPESLAA